MQLKSLTSAVLLAQAAAQEELICRHTLPRLARSLNDYNNEPGVKPIGCCPPNDPDGKLYGPNKACCCDKVYRPDEAFCCQPTGQCDELTQIMRLDQQAKCQELTMFHNPPKFCPETSEIEEPGEILSCSDDNNFGSKCGLECQRGYTKVDMRASQGASQGSNDLWECQNTGLWSPLNAQKEREECCRPTCPPFLPEDAKADFFIVLDKSSSIRSENFHYVKEFMLKIMNTFPLGPDTVQVRLTTYNSIVEEVFNLTESATLPLTAIHDRIKSIAYEGRGTNTGDGLQDVVDNALAHPSNRRDARDFLLLVTDGRSKQRNQITAATNELKSKGVEMLAIGVGDQVRESELRAIASEPVDDHMRIIRDYAALVGMSDWVLATQCPELTCH